MLLKQSIYVSFLRVQRMEIDGKWIWERQMENIQNGKHLKLGPSPIYRSRGLHVLIIMLFLIYCLYREIKPSQVAQW